MARLTRFISSSRSRNMPADPQAPPRAAHAVGLKGIEHVRQRRLHRARRGGIGCLQRQGKLERARRSSAVERFTAIAGRSRNRGADTAGPWSPRFSRAVTAIKATPTAIARARSKLAPRLGAHRPRPRFCRHDDSRSCRFRPPWRSPRSRGARTGRRSRLPPPALTHARRNMVNELLPAGRLSRPGTRARGARGAPALRWRG